MRGDGERGEGCEGCEGVCKRGVGLGVGVRARVDLLVRHRVQVLEAALAALAVQRLEDQLYPPRLDRRQAPGPDRLLDDRGRREAHLLRARVRLRAQVRARG